jgi:hypothetical protein
MVAYEKLEIFLDRQEKEKNRMNEQPGTAPQFFLIPVLYELEFEQCTREGVKALHEDWPKDVPNLQGTEDARKQQLDEWVELVQKLKATTVKRPEQVKNTEQ